MSAPVLRQWFASWACASCDRPLGVLVPGRSALMPKGEPPRPPVACPGCRGHVFVGKGWCSVPELHNAPAVDDAVPKASERLRYELLPFEALPAIVRVLAFGASKHGDHNWKTRPALEHVAAAFRHLVKHQLGELRDPDTGEPHVAHAACRLLFLVAIAAGVRHAGASLDEDKSGPRRAEGGEALREPTTGRTP